MATKLSLRTAGILSATKNAIKKERLKLPLYSEYLDAKLDAKMYFGRKLDAKF